MAEGHRPLPEEPAAKAKGKGKGLDFNPPPPVETGEEIAAGVDTGWAIGFGRTRRATFVNMKRPRRR